MTFVFACMAVIFYLVVSLGAVLGLLSLGEWFGGRVERKNAQLAWNAELEAEAARLLGGPYRGRA